MATNKNDIIMQRQGDVLITTHVYNDKDQLVPVQAGKLTEIKRTGRGVVLAEGEVTGHAHRIAHRSAKLYRDENDARYLRVGGTAPVALTHEEHAPVKIIGDRRIAIHVEYQPGELPRQVAD